MEEYLPIILQIAATLVALIPLVVALVRTVRTSVKEKNWSALLAMVMTLMAEAEQKFECGADRKEWVIDMVKASARSINYDFDDTQLSELIDSLIELTKNVNVVQIMSK